MLESWGGKTGEEEIEERLRWRVVEASSGCELEECSGGG
jgi:hypothetical protein